MKREEQPQLAIVADRDRERCELLAQMLRDRGYQVCHAADGVTARTEIAARRPAVVFLNAFLPGVLGVTLCSEIKRHPELADTMVVLVGSQYRRDRFVRDPHGLYGADAFLDGSGDPTELRKSTDEILASLGPIGETPEVAEASDAQTDLERLARIIAGDIILYNPSTVEEEIAAGRFFDTFAAEIREGENLVQQRFPEFEQARDLFYRTLRETIEQHGQAAGIAAGADRKS